MAAPFHAAERSMEQHQQMLRKLEVDRLSRTVNVPNNEEAVKAALRRAMEPITLFGENHHQRRERLKSIVAVLMVEKKPVEHIVYGPSGILQLNASGRDGEEISQGSLTLRNCRLRIARVSLENAKKRVEKQKLEQNDPVESKDRVEMVIQYSQVGDSRPLSCCAVAPDNQTLMVGSWSGNCSVWNVTSASRVAELTDNTDHRVSDVCFHPFSNTAISSYADGVIRIWSDSNWSCKSRVSAHSDRVSRVRFHPLGDYFICSSLDGKWSLWDLESSQCLIQQDGHTDGVFGLAVHPDGSLVFSGDLTGMCRVWDIRTGRKILDLKGHALGVVSLASAPDGYHFASGSQDNSVRIWDLRKKKLQESLAGHLGVVSEVVYGSSALYSASFDRTVKVWSLQSHSLLDNLVGHEDKVSGCGILGEQVVTVSHDRTWKLWKSQSINT